MEKQYYEITGNTWAGRCYHPFKIGDKVRKTGQCEIWGYNIKYQVYKWGVFGNKYGWVIDRDMKPMDLRQKCQRSY